MLAYNRLLNYFLKHGITIEYADAVQTLNYVF